MSDQSPWGAPPPSSPYGGPPSQPPGGGWNAPPSYGGPGGPGGQPPRRKTGLVLGIVAAVVLVVAAFVVTLVVAGGDDEPDEASPTSASETSEPTSEPTETETSEPSEPTTPTPSTETSGPTEPGGGQISGDGYTFDLPGEAWRDASEEGAQYGPTIDAVAILGTSLELSQSNVIVEALSANNASTVEDLEALWKRNLSGADGATPEDVDDITIDGERAIGVRIEDRVNAAGNAVHQIAYLVLHGGNQYSVGLTFPAQGDNVSEVDFDQMLQSWTWTS